MGDIKTQWQKPISTKKLREPYASYICMKTVCHYPSTTPEKLSLKMNIPLNTIYHWWSKYYYNSRINAYLEQSDEEIEKQKREIVQSDNQNYIDRLPEIHEILSNMGMLLKKNTDKVINNLKKDKQLTKEQIQQLKALAETYTNMDKNHATTSNTYLQNNRVIEAERYNKDEMSPAARALVEQFERITYDDKK